MSRCAVFGGKSHGKADDDDDGVMEENLRETHGEQSRDRSRFDDPSAVVGGEGQKRERRIKGGRSASADAKTKPPTTRNLQGCRNSKVWAACIDGNAPTLFVLLRGRKRRTDYY